MSAAVPCREKLKMVEMLFETLINTARTASTLNKCYSLLPKLRTPKKIYNVYQKVP